jgi:hypothetical protein
MLREKRIMQNMSKFLRKRSTVPCLSITVTCSTRVLKILGTLGRDRRIISQLMLEKETIKDSKWLRVR